MRAHVARGEPASTQSGREKLGRVVVPVQSALAARALTLQGLIGNRAVSAMLSRWPAGVVLEGQSMMVQFDAGLYAVEEGTEVEVLEPLERKNGSVRARQGEYPCWIDLLSLKPADPHSPLGIAISRALGDSMLRELKRDRTLEHLSASLTTLAESTGPSSVGADIDAVRKAVVHLDNERNRTEDLAARRGVRLVIPAEMADAERAAREQMQNLCVMNAIDSLVSLGASPETLGHYRKLRDALEYAPFKGLAADPDVARSLHWFEGAVERAIADAGPLTDEPNAVLRGGHRVEHAQPGIGAGSAYQTVAGETVGMGEAGSGAATSAQTRGSGTQPVDVVAGPVIDERNPWAADVPGDPIVTHVRDDRPETASLYIDGRPTADDVRQGGLGDCFYLALVISVAERDPMRIKFLLPDAGADPFFSVTFYYRPTRHSTLFIPRTVRLPVTLAFRAGTEGLSGAQFRIAPTGVSRWTLVRDGDGHLVREERLYKTALWAPLMEKAYARFAQEHGMYGELFGHPGRADKLSGGYELIGDSGGSSQLVAGVMYGSDVMSQNTVETSAMRGAGDPGREQPGAELVAALAGIDFGGDYGEITHVTAGADSWELGERAVRLAQLILDEDRFPDVVKQKLISLRDAWNPDETELPDDFRAAAAALADPLKFLDEGTVGTDRDVIRRHIELIAQLTPPTDADDQVGLARAQNRLEPTRAVLDDTTSMSNTGIDLGEFTDLRTTQAEAFSTKDPHFAARRMIKLVNLARNLAEQIGREHALRAHWALRADPRGAALLELALSLRHKGDTSAGQRFIYAGHAYAVLDAVFLNAQGVFLEVMPESVDFWLPQIDADRSTVTLRNPHHENRPDPGATQSRGTGEFRISLAQFARQFSNVREALVKMR